MIDEKWTQKNVQQKHFLPWKLDGLLPLLLYFRWFKIKRGYCYCYLEKEINNIEMNMMALILSSVELSLTFLTQQKTYF